MIQNKMLAMTRKFGLFILACVAIVVIIYPVFQKHDDDTEYKEVRIVSPKDFVPLADPYDHELEHQDVDRDDIE